MLAYIWGTKKLDRQTDGRTDWYAHTSLSRSVYLLCAAHDEKQKLLTSTTWFCAQMSRQASVTNASWYSSKCDPEENCSKLQPPHGSGSLTTRVSVTQTVVSVLGLTVIPFLMVGMRALPWTETRRPVAIDRRRSETKLSAVAVVGNLRNAIMLTPRIDYKTS